MYKVRRYVIRHANFFESLYHVFESFLLFLDPIFRFIGYQRIEKPVAFLEKIIKGFLFDTTMCGMCTLSSTGMACPMNCPKQLRNGPCGGVRANGNCEIEPEMRCVWVDAYEGSLRMSRPDSIETIQLSVDQRLKGSSAWLREIRIKVDDINIAKKIE